MSRSSTRKMECVNDAKQVVKEGAVFKKGDSVMSGWKQRYLILYKDKHLSYFMRDDLEHRGTIYIDDLHPSAVQPSDKQSKSAGATHGFRIQSLSRAWYFAVKSSVERDSWIKAIRLTMQGKVSSIQYQHYAPFSSCTHMDDIDCDLNIDMDTDHDMDVGEDESCGSSRGYQFTPLSEHCDQLGDSKPEKREPTHNLYKVQPNPRRAQKRAAANRSASALHQYHHQNNKRRSSQTKPSLKKATSHHLPFSATTHKPRTKQPSSPLSHDSTNLPPPPPPHPLHQKSLPPYYPPRPRVRALALQLNQQSCPIWMSTTTAPASTNNPTSPFPFHQRSDIASQIHVAKDIQFQKPNRNNKTLLPTKTRVATCMQTTWTYDRHLPFSKLVRGFIAQQCVGSQTRNNIPLQQLLLPVHYLCQQYIGYIFTDCSQQNNGNELLQSRLLRTSFTKHALLQLVCRGMNAFILGRVQLLYRGSRDGFKSKAFHAHCDGYANTLTICYSKHGTIFGGFTQIPWSTDGQYHCDPKAFLFAMTTTGTTASCSNAQFKMFKLKPGEAKYAVLHYKEYGAVFGRGHDLAIFSLSDNNLDTQSCCHSYSASSKQLLGNWMYCSLHECEVYRIYTN